jgi:hypothetical protein
VHFIYRLKKNLTIFAEGMPFAKIDSFFALGYLHLQKLTFVIFSFAYWYTHKA